MRIEQTQEVQIFRDEKLKATQSVVVEIIENEEDWIVIEHDHKEISLSISNWRKLIRLSEKVIKEATNI
jgi:hypothetical protein